MEACAGGGGGHDNGSRTITIPFPLDHYGHLATASCAGLLSCQAREADRQAVRVVAPFTVLSVM